jgi:hypothetical protein
MKKLKYKVEDVSYDLSLRLASARIPRRYWHLTMQGYLSQKIAEPGIAKIVRAFAKSKSEELRTYTTTFSSADYTKLEKSFRIGMYLYGPSRSGKTFLLSHMAKTLCLNGATVSYHTVDDLKALHFQNDKAFRFREVYVDIPLLFLDGVSAPKNEAYRTSLSRLLRLRCDQGIPTVIASDIPLKEFVQYYSMPRMIDVPGQGQEKSLVPEDEAATLVRTNFVPVTIRATPELRLNSEIDLLTEYGKELTNESDV